MTTTSTRQASYFVKVQIDERVQMRLVRSDETFRELKTKLLEGFVDENQTGKSSLSSVTLKLNFSSSVRRSKIPKIANDFDAIVATVNREEILWPGSVTIVVNFKKSRSDPQYANENDEYVNNFSKGISCTEFVPTNMQLPISQIEFSNALSFPEAFFAEIGNTCLRQGRLQQNIVTRKQEIWREEYFLLDTNRLWYLPVKAWETEKQLSYIDLNEDTSAKMLNVSTCSFKITYNKNGRGAMTLKAKSKEEADHWINDINNRKGKKSDNEILFAIDNVTADTEEKCSFRDLDKLRQITSFEGMLFHSSLRGLFRKYLLQVMLAEALLFWERAEDYRRGHPYSSQPFSKGTGDKKSAARGNNANQTQYVKAWASIIYKNFLDPEAQHRIPYINETEVLAIREKIENIVSCPPSSLFESIQKVCYDKMRLELYPEFVKQDHYRKAFQIAIRQSSQTTANASNRQLDSNTSFTNNPPNSNPVLTSNFSTSPANNPPVKRSFFRMLGFGSSSSNKNGNNGSFSSNSSSHSTTNTSTSIQPTNQSVLQHQESVKASEPKDLGSTQWRNETHISEENYWLPDIWWDCVKSSSGSSEGGDLKSDALKPLMSKYLKFWDTLVCNKDIETTKELHGQFKPGKVRENIEPVFDEMFTPNSPAPTSPRNIAPKPSPLLPMNILLPGGCVGLVSMSGLMRCQYRRRQGNTSTPAVFAVPSSVQTNDNSSGRGGKAPNPQSPNMQRPATSNSVVMPSEDFVRKRSLSDDFVGPNGPSTDWKLQFVVLTEWLGRGRLLLLDPVTYILNAVIAMESVAEIAVTESLLHAILIKDKLGLNWQMVPEPVNEEDGKYLSQRWMSMLACYCTQNAIATRILHTGVLAKRGQRNNALRKRWFVLTSDRVLRYYKDDVFKGDINLNKVATINQNKVSSDYGGIFNKGGGNETGDLRAIVLWTQDRLWIVQADTTEDCTRWFNVLRAFVDLISKTSVLPNQVRDYHPNQNSAIDSDEDSVD